MIDRNAKAIRNKAQSRRGADWQDGEPGITYHAIRLIGVSGGNARRGSAKA